MRRLVGFAIGLVLVGSFAWLLRKLLFSLDLQHDSISQMRVNSSFDGHSIRPLEMPENLDPDRVTLGKKLFFDTRLSHDETISCHSCHNLKNGGADGRQFSVGLNGTRGQVNAPTVFNSALNFRQFWNGRAEGLADQAVGPITNPVEMGSSWEEIIPRLEKDREMKEEFKRVFNDEIKADLIIAAIVEFERSLVTLNSRFDLYLKGDQNAIDEAEIRGYRKFSQYGCIACHQGQNVGGNMFQTMGVAFNYFAERGGRLDSDEGRHSVTQNEADRHVFKVPSLRNVELTAPYFHDGSEPNLENAIRKMARYQLGRVLPDEDVRDISLFLKTLTGERPSVLGEKVVHEQAQ